MSGSPELPIRLVLVDPPRGIDFGIQRGRGAEYETLLVQQRGRDAGVSFDFALSVDAGKGRTPNFSGPFVQGPSGGRFIYIDVGTYAGQAQTTWSRRIKVPLEGITRALVDKALSRRGYRLQARIPGTGRDGGPSSATVGLLDGWTVVEEKR